MPARQPFGMGDQQRVVNERADRRAGGARLRDEPRQISAEPERSRQEQAVTGGEARRDEPNSLALRPSGEQDDAVVGREQPVAQRPRKRGGDRFGGAGRVRGRRQTRRRIGRAQLREEGAERRKPCALGRDGAPQQRMPEQRPCFPENGAGIGDQLIRDIEDRAADAGGMARDAELIEEFRDIDPDRARWRGIVASHSFRCPVRGSSLARSLATTRRVP